MRQYSPPVFSGSARSLLLSLLTIDSNGYLSSAYVSRTSPAWAPPALEYVASNVKGYVYNAEFEVHWDAPSG